MIDPSGHCCHPHPLFPAGGRAWFDPAALALNVAPSSVSRILRQFKDELGTSLFERVRQRLKLTSAGQLMLYRARLSLSELKGACSEITGLHRLHRKTVSVAVIEGVSRGLMPDALQEFWKRHPGITVNVCLMGPQHAVNAVAEGECDHALMFDIKGPRSVDGLKQSRCHSVFALPNSRLKEKTELRLFDIFFYIARVETVKVAAASMEHSRVYDLLRSLDLLSGLGDLDRCHNIRFDSS